MKLVATALFFLVAPGCGFDSSGVGGGGTGDGDVDDDGAVTVDAARPIIDAAPPPPDAATGIHLRVEALMDGRSHLLVQGTTVQWLHFDNAAPGRHAGANAPTVIDGVDWFPVWPDDPDAENRDCGCLSDVHDGLAVALPSADASATITEIEARGSTAIVEEPAAGNDYTLVIEISDNGLGGSDTYIVEVDTLVIE